ncbi:MAG: PLP-dependent aminotransferase family protein [Planctomycetota bacterium]|nr:MAG: PLP-dependent aminotransferase family protein [Planctomycetota bacterium]REK21678.1 MAG: PLP-dependent aminotransferase family protein [Planctomycetota bacterium]REK32760.1 MAG: PLP-dependent aminotransferase family protein [Planctomycetota bacterium]
MSTNTETTAATIRLSRRWHYAREQAISFLMQQAVENPDVISLAAGLVDSQSLPVAETRTALAEIFEDESRARQALQYGTTPGAEDVRLAVLDHFARQERCPTKDLGIDAGQLVLTTGSQQLLSIVCEILLDEGDICLVAGPTYFVFLGNLNGVGAEAVSVPADENGMLTGALDNTLAELDRAGQLDRVKMIYAVSYYDNPSGTSLSPERRREIVEIARRWSRRQRIFVLEDAAYRELRYDGPLLESIWSCDESRQHVIYTQTYSKTYSPGLRVGFGVVPRELVGPICDRKGNEDFGSANLNQRLIACVLRNGLYDKHVEDVQTAYRRKRNAMLAAAEEHFSKLAGVTWVHPHGGLYVWMSLPEQIHTGFNSPLFDRAVHHEGVMYVPGELFYAGERAERPAHQMRLSYGVQTPDGIREGIARLARAVKSVI